MRRYYKEKFEKQFKYKSKMKDMTSEEMDAMISGFLDTQFPDLMVPGPSGDAIISSLKMVILCDRYNKDEPIIKSLDFTVIRNVLNKYNSKNLGIFLSEGANAYLFINFFMRGGQQAA